MYMYVYVCVHAYKLRLSFLYTSKSEPEMHCSESAPEMHSSESEPEIHCCESAPEMHCSESAPEMHVLFVCTRKSFFIHNVYKRKRTYSFPYMHIYVYTRISTYRNIHT
jgi:hypothetical protein